MIDTTSSNPALVIGLGGTGQWVLTYVKNNLIDRFGAVPPQIRLFAFDTTGEDSEVYKGSITQPVEETAQVGEVRLTPNTEFIYLGGNIKKLCEQIVRQNQHKHIGSWLQAEDYLGTLSDDGFNLSRGAGQRRQFGRMAVFYDLMTINGNKVVGKISEALHTIADQRKKNQPIDIYVVASVAGGTGSGMFIDIAHLARVLAEREARTDITVRGFLALPNTFQSVIRVDQVKASGYAAIRELDRFLSTLGRGYPINYSDDPLVRDLQTVYRSKLFDNCFLIDAERTQQSLRLSKPQHGVYPSIADSITMMIDPSAGDTFQQHYKNVSNEGINTQKRKGHAIYGSLGTFSYILPVRDIRQACTLRFVNEFLQKHFVDIASTNTGGSMDQALVDDVVAFLQQSASRAGVQNTPFVQGSTLLVRNGNLNDNAYIQKVSARGRDLSELLELSGEDSDSQQLKQRLHGLFHLLVTDEVSTSIQDKEDDYESAAIRIPDQVDSFKRKYLGELSSETGKRHQGELRRILDAVLDINSRRFGETLREVSLSILNERGISAHGGRLSHLQSFLAQIVKIFDDFGVLIERVRQQRNRDGQVTYAREDVRRALTRLDQSRKKAGLAGVVRRRFSSKAEEDYAQEDYLRAEQYLIDLEIEEILFTELINTSRILTGIAQTILSDVNTWIAIWATGDLAAHKPSVYRLVSDTLSKISEQRESKRRIQVHSYLTDDAYEDQLYQKFSSGKAEHLLGRFSWTCQEQSGRITLNLQLDGNSLPHTDAIEKVVPENSRVLLAAVDPYFGDIERLTIAERLQELFTPEKLANEMQLQSAPLINVQKEAAEAAHYEVQTFVSIDEKKAIGFTTDTETHLKKLVNTPKDAQVIAASDPYRCVIVSTADLIGIDAIQSLQDAKKAYELQPDGAGQKRQLHNFPAEIHAVVYEKRLGEYPFYTKGSHQQYFLPQVVMVLENTERFELFMLSYATGIIQIEDSLNDLRKQHYVLRLKRERRYDRAYALDLTEPDARPSLLEAVQTFVFRQPDKADIDPQNLITAVDGNLSVTEERVKETLRNYEDLIQWGLEHQVRPFGRYLRSLRWSEAMQAMVPVLKSEFRYFLMENTNAQVHIETLEDAREAVQRWLSDLKDLKIATPQDVVNKAAELVLTANKIVQDGKDPNRLRRRLEEVILEKVPELQRSKEQEDRDLGTLLHIVVWDYIQRLEQIEWHKN